MPLNRLHLLLTLAAALCLGVPAAPAQTNFVNFEGKQTRPIRLSPDGTRLFAVNTPDARVSVFDVSQPSNPVLIAEISVGLEPVSVNPLNNDEAWVVNEVSDSVSIISVSRAMVVETLPARDEPMDVVFAGGRAFVSCSRNNVIRVFDIVSRSSLATIPVFGENPRALAVSPDATKVFAAFALSGNRTTLVPANLAPPQPPPSNTNLPAPPQVALIVDGTDPAWSGVVQTNMPDHDVVEIDAATMTTNRYFRRVGTVNFALAVHPLNGDLFVANNDAANLTHFEPVLNGRFYTNRISRIATNNGTVTHLNLDPASATNSADLSSKSNALAQPTAIVFDPGGAFMWVAAFGTDRIAKVGTNGTVLERIHVGPPAAQGAGADPRNKRGPRGLALHASANRLYVLNRLANSISVIDTGANTVLREFAAGSHDPTPAAVRQGRGFLYDAKLSGNGTVSCASCHIDSELDLIAWDLGNPGGDMDSMTAKISGTQLIIPGGITTNFQFHPMKGPMTTQTLRGLNTQEPFHWRGDRTNFNHFNGAFASLLGGATLSGPDMNAYRDFIDTVVFSPNPNQNLDRSLPTNFAGGNPVQGRFTFTNEVYTSGLMCNTCHLVPSGTDRSITPAQALQESQSFKVPHLRNMYQKTGFTRTNAMGSVGGFGFLHDGTFTDIFTFLSQPVFGTFAGDTTRKQNLNAFLQCFDTGIAPAVGYTRTITSNNIASVGVTNDWITLEGQSGATNCDLVVKGTIDGQLRGLVYRRATGDYASDRTGVGPFTREQLIARVQAGDTLTVMGVPFGSGNRLGIDRNQNSIPDGDEPPPLLQVAQSAGNALLSWPTNDFWFVLESSASAPPFAWSTVTDVRGTAGSNVVVTNPVSGPSGFFRLRRPW